MQEWAWGTKERVRFCLIQTIPRIDEYWQGCPRYPKPNRPVNQTALKQPRVREFAVDIRTTVLNSGALAVSRERPRAQSGSTGFRKSLCQQRMNEKRRALSRAAFLVNPRVPALCGTKRNSPRGTRYGKALCKMALQAGAGQWVAEAFFGMVNG